MMHKTIVVPLHVTNTVIGERNITPNTQMLTNWDKSLVEKSALIGGIGSGKTI